MSRTQTAYVNPPILAWARSIARMKEAQAAKKASVSPERLVAWEQGEQLPTLRQARLLASAYRVPFATFFLPEPPSGVTRIPRDLRRHAGETIQDLSSDLQLDVRDSWDRREIALELLASSGATPTLFSFTANLDEDPEVVGPRLREVLGLPVEEQLSWRDTRVAFNRWRQLAESAGVLVFQTSAVALVELRAYSLAAETLPVVVVNRKDPYPARIFSLLHELAHLGLHTEGICDLRTDDSRPPEEQRLEVFCNAVAAAALVPRASLLGHPIVVGNAAKEWDESSIAHLARLYSCSREALLRRLLTFGRTTEAFYRLKREQYREEYASRPKSKGFVTPSADAVSLLGRPLVRLVLDELSSQRITSSDAADYLGVRLKHLPAISAAVADSEK